MDHKEELLFAQSKAWIEKYFEATTNDLPDELLEIWMEDEEQISKHEDTLPVRIFIYAYLGYRIAKNGQVSLEELTEDELFRAYYYWQVKLAGIDANRKSHLHLAPRPLFSFDEKEIFMITEKKLPEYNFGNTNN